MNGEPKVADTQLTLMGMVVVNNYTATLPYGVSGGATSIIVDNINFPTWATGQWCALTLLGSDGKPKEIVYATGWSVSGIFLTLSVIRGQEGTSAQTLLFGTKIEMRLTAGQLAMIQASAAEDVSADETNNWTAKQTFGAGANIAGLNVTGGTAAQFTGTATFGAQVTVNGSATITGNIAAWGGDNIFAGLVLGDRSGQWNQALFEIADGNQRAGALRWESSNAAACEFGYRGNGGVYFWKDGVSDYFYIDPDGNFYSLRATQIFGGSGLVLDIIKSYIDNQDNNNRGVRTGGGWWNDLRGTDGWRDNTWTGGGQYIDGVTTTARGDSSRVLDGIFAAQMQVLIGGNWVNVWGY